MTPGRLIAISFIAFAMLGCAPRVDNTGPVSRGFDERVRGVAEYNKGDYQRALERFTEALRLDRSSDDRRSEALDLVDIGRVYITVNDASSARLALNEAVRLASAENYPGPLSEAFATLAKADVMEGKRDEALRHIDEALKAGAALDGKVSGGKLNLKAAIVLSGGSTEEASVLFARALSINEGAGDEAEAANSLRGLGDAAFASGGFDVALKHFEAAYDKDKRLGVSGRIARDLSGMAEAKLKLGRSDEALYLLERSYLVSLGGRDISLASKSIERMISVLEGAGDIEKARSLNALKNALEADRNTGDTRK